MKFAIFFALLAVMPACSRDRAYPNFHKGDKVSFRIGDSWSQNQLYFIQETASTVVLKDDNGNELVLRKADIKSIFRYN